MGVHSVTGVIFSLLIASLSIDHASAMITRRHQGALNRGLLQRTTPQERSSLFSPSALDQYFSRQRLDHFDNLNAQTWNQRFIVNDTMWTKAQNAPVFLMLGGEGPISPAYVSGHFIINQFAEQHGALIIAIEHRFYGQSVPFSDSSTSNLRYLSSQQALADVISFKAYVSTLYSIPSTAPWIAFGGSYSGSLSAWLRLKYPHEISGSFATSAPILAQLDFPEYFDVVSTSLGQTCSDKVRRGYQRVNQLLNQTNGRQTLQTLFNTCSPIVTDRDVQNFLSGLSNPYAEVVQYNDDNIGRPLDIPVLCKELTSIDDDLKAFVNLNAFYYNVTAGGPVCLEVNYTQSILELQPTSDGRSWTYQTCTEFGYYQTGENVLQPFPSAISLEFFLAQCADIFGVPAFTPYIDETNRYYGAKNITTDRTYFANGSVDPWHILGLTSPTPNLGPLSAVSYMKGTAHCADLYAPSPSDVPDLVSTRLQQSLLLTQWLSSPFAPTLAPSSSSSSSSYTTYYIIAIVLLVLVVIALLWFACCRTKTTKSTPGSEPLIQ